MSSSNVGRLNSTSGPSANRSGSLGPKVNEKVALYSLILYKWNQERPVQLSLALDLSSFPFFHRSTMKEHIIFHSRLIASRTQLGKRCVVEFEQNLGHCHVYAHPSGICATVLSTPNYPMRVAFGLISNAIRIMAEKYSGKWEEAKEDVAEGVLLSEGPDLLKEYQDPMQADKLLKVQKDLDEVKDVMLRNIDDLLQRGEKLDDLMQKSEDLSNTSYQFYRQAKKNNSCCSLY